MFITQGYCFWSYCCEIGKCRAEKCDSDLMIFQDVRMICQLSHLFCGYICSGFLGIWILKKTRCRSAQNRFKQPRDCGLDLKCHSGRIVCTLSTSHRWNGTFIGTEPSRRLTFLLVYNNIFFLTNDIMVYITPEMTKGHHKNVKTAFGVYQLCLKFWLHESSTTIG